VKLVCQFPLRPLRTYADLDAAVAVIDALIDQEQALRAGAGLPRRAERSRRGVRGETVPARLVADADMLRFHIEQQGVTQAEVAKKAGIAESTISEVLAGKRKLNRVQIGKLSRFFHVPPGVFTYAV
jgi:HTH-type transcriptional regulator / antitoxin HigA